MELLFCYGFLPNGCGHFLLNNSFQAVSYTHLDVYKRQHFRKAVRQQIRHSGRSIRKGTVRALSLIHIWGDLYVIYPKSEMKKDLNTTRYGVDQAVQELVDVGNLVRIIPKDVYKRQEY